jgi:hypothetical protein
MEELARKICEVSREEEPENIATPHVPVFVEKPRNKFQARITGNSPPSVSGDFRLHAHTRFFPAPQKKLGVPCLFPPFVGNKGNDNPPGPGTPLAQEHLSFV